jgi:hypothetical protein
VALRTLPASLLAGVPPHRPARAANSFRAGIRQQRSHKESSGTTKRNDDRPRKRRLTRRDYADNLDKGAFWPKIMPIPTHYRDALAAQGGVASLIELPKQGITGNTHMLMMDRNSDQIAAIVQDWMTRQGLEITLDEFPPGPVSQFRRRPAWCC